MTDDFEIVLEILKELNEHSSTYQCTLAFCEP